MSQLKSGHFLLFKKSPFDVLKNIFLICLINAGHSSTGAIGFVVVGVAVAAADDAIYWNSIPTKKIHTSTEREFYVVLPIVAGKGIAIITELLV